MGTVSLPCPGDKECLDGRGSRSLADNSLEVEIIGSPGQKASVHTGGLQRGQHAFSPGADMVFDSSDSAVTLTIGQDISSESRRSNGNVKSSLAVMGSIGIMGRIEAIPYGRDRPCTRSLVPCTMVRRQSGYGKERDHWNPWYLRFTVLISGDEAPGVSQVVGCKEAAPFPAALPESRPLEP